MSIINTLHNLLKHSLPDFHATRLKALMAAVGAGLTGASVSITALGRAVSGATFIKHKIKRLDRLVGNPHLKSERVALYGAMTQLLLKSLPLPLIIMQHENKFSPRVGVVYQPWKWLSLYGNYVESFGTNNGRNALNVSFAPQASEQYEAGFKTEFFDKKLSSTVAFYNLTKTNILAKDLNSLNPNDQIAIGEARSRGIEVDVKGQLSDEFSLITTYAYTDARVTKDNIVTAGGLLGKRLPAVPEHQASLWGTYQFTKQFKAGLGGVVVDQRQGDAANTYQLPGYARLDAMAAYMQPIGKTRLTTQININNLLDKEYFTGSTSWLPTANVGAPISVMGSLKWEY